MKFNILFIDDEKDIISAYKSILTSCSQKKELSSVDNLLSELGVSPDLSDNLISSDQFMFYSALNGKEGVDIIRKQNAMNDPINVCFVDFRMPPGMNGKETIQSIREIDKRVEIVLVTAYSDVDVGDVVRSVNCPDKLLFLKKPFDNREIKQLIRNLTRKYFDAQVRENFVSNVSHELKTPLASIIGYSQLLLEEGLEGEHLDFVKVIYDNSLLMKEQVDDLITIAEFRKKGKSLNCEIVTASDLAREVELLMKPIFSATDLKFLVSTKQDFLIKIDKNKFKQCLINLLTNSRKFTVSGSVTLDFSIANGEGLIKVIDTGKGIAENKVNRIFEKFYRVEDKHHSQPGLGLGLSIVKNIVELHGMKIEVSSKLGLGTTFTIIADLADSKRIVA